MLLRVNTNAGQPRTKFLDVSGSPQPAATKPKMIGFCREELRQIVAEQID
ncbi:hypothetical protein [Neorhizobium sp. DT-125]